MGTKPANLLVFGGCGFVGTHLVRAARNRGIPAKSADFTAKGPDSFALDITNAERVAEVIAQAEPSAVINVAAIADIDRAQTQQEMARQVNVEGASHVAATCTALEIRHVFISTDAVFDGRHPPYRETDPVSPVNYYGRTKADAEMRVARECPEAAIVRLSLVLGLAVSGGNSFLSGLRAKLTAGVQVAQPVTEVRTPIDVHTLCECLMEVSACGFSGVLHLGSTGSVDRLTLSRRLAQLMGFDPSLVVEAGPPTPDRAPRHTGGILEVSRAQGVLTTKLVSVEQTLRRALDKEDRRD